MGQTLTHGIYLPDEGERNCYSGLAANWQLLDGAVGTIAEHTTALAGKAPAVHTHTKSDITDFPIYGTTAGTICEGNDSRLSDARTPVAHTHAKSDVTDLLNSNFIPSANNSYDLGSSSYQWNNLYAKNYYYNGTAWGLDKANVWSANQKIERPSANVVLTLQRDDIQLGDNIPANNKEIGTVTFSDKNSQNIGFIGAHDRATGYTYTRILTRQKYTNGQRSTTGTACESIIDVGIDPIGQPYIAPGNNNIDLGTSTNKWKTLNGVNPGGLSLPAYDSANSSMLDYDPINTDGWSLTGSGNNVSITEDGYVYISVLCGTDGYVVITEGQYGYPNCFYMATGTHIGGAASAILPVRKGIGITVYCRGTSVYLARFFPAQGNV